MRIVGIAVLGKFGYPHGLVHAKTGGHAVQIITAGLTLGVPFIEFRHDCAQTTIDGDPNDTKGLVDVESKFIDLDGDSLFNIKSNRTEVALVVTMEVENKPPAKPSPPHQGFGMIWLHNGTEYTFTTSTTDPEGHNISYIFDWGDGNTTEVGPYPSGDTANASHSWDKFGWYKIKVKARDQFFEYSDWSDEIKRFVPGFEAIIVIAALAITFIILRKRKQK